MNFKKNIFGFTLIELIVTVTVIMVLAGVGAMSLNNFNGAKELESVRDEVSDHLKLARNLAITKQLPNGAYNLEYVKVNIDNNKITIAGAVGLTVYTASPYSIKIVNSSMDISVTSSSGFGFMKSTGRLTDNIGNLVGTTMTVEVSRGTDKKTININNAGIISNAVKVTSNIDSDEKTRDNQRIADLNKIMAALIAMKQAGTGNTYPWWLNKVEEYGYIDKLPLDPKNNSKYCFWAANPPETYLAALMEDIGSTNTRKNQLIGGYNQPEYCYFNYKLMLPP